MQRQLGTIVLPPDPVAVMNSRIEPYTIDEQESILEDETSAPFTGFGNILQDQNLNDLFSGGQQGFTFTAPVIGPNPYPPTLAWDFTDGSGLPSWITASGGANGTYFNAAGLLMNGIAPRFDYNPVTHVCNGLLIEEARTNLVPNSTPLTLTWTFGNASFGGSTTGPDGLQSLKLVVGDGTLNRYSLYQSYTATAAAYTNTIYAKAGVYTWAGLGFGTGANLDGAYFNLSTGAIGTIAAGTTASIQNIGNGIYRLSVTRTLSAGATFLQMEPHSADNQAGWTSDGVNGVYFGFAQAELGSFPTSYIPTTSASVTRSADVLTGSSALLNSTQGSVLAQFLSSNPNDKTVFSASDGSFTNRFEISNTASGTAMTFVGVSSGILFANNAYVSGLTLGSFIREMLAYKVGIPAYGAANGGGVSDAGSGHYVVPSLSTISFGSRSAFSDQYLNGWIQQIAFYNLALPSSIVQSKSIVGTPL